MKPPVWTPLGLLALALVQSPDEEAAPGPGVQVASSCARCHSNAPTATAMRSADGDPIAPYDLWRGTMMANSARDPLWRAVLSAEIAALPDRRAEIEATCLRCHAPMAHLTGLDDHGTGSLLHALDCDGELGDLARDGVSCTICHGISPEGLGTEQSFTAGFVLDDRRRLFGPHDAPFAMPMQRTTGFTPTRGDHITDSALCGTCHTLETEVLDGDGRATGAVFLEQSPYLEWRNSAFDRERAEPGPRAADCADCHVPTSDGAGAPIATRIARNPGGRDFPPTAPREPYGRHLFVGGNTLVPALFRDHPEVLRVEAPAAAFDATIEAARRQLGTRTARLEITRAERADGRLRFAVDLENLTGHKFPTAHPTRRAWLRVVVRDAAGAVLFASGATDDRGRILDGEGAPLASELAGGPVPPHRDRITSADQVALYRAVMADSDGVPTHTLLRGAHWYVDDRLLPVGWSGEHADADRIRPVGVDGDPNFGAGRDQVSFDLALEADEPVTIEATLLYQTLSARWAAELLRWETPEVQLFGSLYEQADRSPEVVASDRRDA